MNFLKSIGPLELIIVLVIVLMVFGVGKLPQVGAAIGKTIRGFKESVKSDDDEEVEEAPKRKVRKSTKKTAQNTQKP